MKKKKQTPAEIKADSLRKHGTFNTKASKIKDELFSQRRFFDGRDLVQVKYEMLRRVQHDEWSISQAAEMFGFSRPSFYEAMEHLEKEGLVGLIPKLRGPKGPHKITEEALHFLESCLDTKKSVSSQDPQKLLIDRFQINVHPRSIGRALARWKKKGAEHE